MSNESNPYDAITNAVTKLADMMEGFATASLVTDVSLAKLLLEKGLITKDEFHSNLDQWRKAFEEGKSNHFTDVLINAIKGMTEHD